MITAWFDSWPAAIRWVHRQHSGRRYRISKSRTEDYWTAEVTSWPTRHATSTPRDAA